MHITIGIHDAKIIDWLTRLSQTEQEGIEFPLGVSNLAESIAHQAFVAEVNCRMRPATTEPPCKLRVDMTLNQAKELVEFFGGDFETEVTVEVCKEGHSGPGLYAYCTDYPEEGGVLLNEKPDPEGKPTQQPAPPRRQRYIWQTTTLENARQFELYDLAKANAETLHCPFVIDGVHFAAWTSPIGKHYLAIVRSTNPAEFSWFIVRNARKAYEVVITPTRGDGVFGNWLAALSDALIWCEKQDLFV